ncbi:Uncharacterised protein [Mycobacterium tuberculosis]|nr:Uncharacterised protein [Mycobacterium tuberculosis]CKU05550.1 Uncharacterised protein [Mycobacterium tuberculosis]CKX63281.1 Uncharacterised protein [Mycobacterium tuberculosis]SGO69692.1 Uncharacterised protein [Mycobacterium tuberculosis]
MLSSETLTRSRPASARAPARRASPTPLVVSEISGRGRSLAVAATTSSRWWANSGSPPVNRTLVTPSRVTAMCISLASSSGRSSCSPGSHLSPRSGMQ